MARLEVVPLSETERASPLPEKAPSEAKSSSFGNHPLLIPSNNLDLRQSLDLWPFSKDSSA
jgi:hypothetical protein